LAFYAKTVYKSGLHSSIHHTSSSFNSFLHPTKHHHRHISFHPSSSSVLAQSTACNYDPDAKLAAATTVIPTATTKDATARDLHIQRFVKVHQTTLLYLNIRLKFPSFILQSRSIRAQRSMDVRLQEQEPPMNDEINGSMLMAPNNSNTLLSTPTSSRSTALARSTSNLQINILATSPQRKQTTPTTALARSASNLQINILATSPQRKQTTPIALRLGPGFDSDQEDECMINEPLDRTTLYNQQEEQQPISVKF
jgi:hypothetical protein